MLDRGTVVPVGGGEEEVLQLCGGVALGGRVADADAGAAVANDHRGGELAVEDGGFNVGHVADGEAGAVGFSGVDAEVNGGSDDDGLVDDVDNAGDFGEPLFD